MSERYSMMALVRFGYFAFLVSLSCFPWIEESVEAGELSRKQAYWALLGSVLLTAIGGGLQQSSLYGLMAVRSSYCKLTYLDSYITL